MKEHEVQVFQPQHRLAELVGLPAASEEHAHGECADPTFDPGCLEEGAGDEGGGDPEQQEQLSVSAAVQDSA